MANSSTQSDPAGRRPSGNWWLSFGLSLVGLGVSTYLTWVKLTGNTASCGSVGDCESVNNSRYAEIGGVPIALFGALSYLVLLALLAMEVRRPQSAEAARLMVFGVSLIGTMYSAYLTYIEVAVLKAICPYCVVSALAITAVLILCVVRLRSADVDA